MNRKHILSVWMVLTGVFLIGANVLAASCADNASPSEVSALESSSKTNSADWQCQKIDLNDQSQVNYCVKGGCPNDPKNVLCCVPNIGVPSGKQTTTQTTVTQSSPGSLSIICKDLEHGNCSLDDIIRTGVSFSQFLFGLSGAIFLGIFVYAGLLYLMSGGDSKNAGKGKEMMVNAVIGMVIIFAAGTIVRFVYVSLTRQAPGVTQCERDHGREGYSCQAIGGGQDELDTRGCLVSGKGQDSLCRIPGQDNNVYCCPIDPPEPKPKDVPST